MEDIGQAWVQIFGENLSEHGLSTPYGKVKDKVVYFQGKKDGEKQK